MKYEEFISKITDFYIKNNLIPKTQIDVFKYGASLTIASIISFAIAIAWGTIFNCFLEVLVFLALFIPLRIFTGGYHASTFFRCVLFLIIILALLTFVIHILPLNVIKPIAVISSFVLIYTVYKYSPIQHPNAPIREENIPKFKKLSLYICVTEVVIIATIIILARFIEIYRSLLHAATFSAITGSVLLYLARISCKRKEV